MVKSTAVGKPLRARAAGVAARGKDGEDIPCSSPPVVSAGLSVDCIRIVYTTLFSCCLPFINGSLLYLAFLLQRETTDPLSALLLLTY